jgi:hypothetical protein
MSALSATILTITTNERRSEMNLDEYIAHIEATQKASLSEAIATLTKANETLSGLFNTKEAD